MYNTSGYARGVCRGVALRCGFEAGCHFARVLRKLTGRSPTEFRRTFRHVSDGTLGQGAWGDDERNPQGGACGRLPGPTRRHRPCILR